MPLPDITVAILVQRARERDLDLLLRLELESCSPAARVLWSKAGLDAPDGSVNVKAQPLLFNGRPADLNATHGGSSHRLLIESKIADGEFEVGQPESYRDHVRETEDVALLVAPTAFLQRMSSHEFHCFGDHAASVEDLASALRSATSIDAQTSAELVRNWRSRADCYDRLAESGSHTISLPVTHFGERYRFLAQKLTDGRVQLNRSVLRHERTGFAQFKPGFPAPPPLYLQHKLPFGDLDLRVPGYTYVELHALIEDAPDELKPPAGWTAAAPRQARRDLKTGQVRPVLRFELGDVVTMPYVFADAEPVLRDAIAAADAVGRWLKAGGYTLLFPPTSDVLLSRLLARAGATALLLGRADIVAAVEQIQGSVTPSPRA